MSTLTAKSFCKVILLRINQVNDIHAAVADVKAKNIRCLSAEPRIGMKTFLDNKLFKQWKLCSSLIA